MLPLIAEAIRLLPDPQRWEATFSTYQTNSLPGVDCRWRCVLQGTDEAAAARRIPGSFVIDLTKPLGEAPDNVLADAARSGEASAPRSSPPPLAPRIRNSRNRKSDEFAPVALATPAVGVATRVVPRAGGLGKPLQPPPRTAKKSAVPWKWISAAALTFLVVVAGGAATWLLQARAARFEERWGQLARRSYAGHGRN